MIRDRILIPLNLADSSFGWAVTSEKNSSHPSLGPRSPDSAGLVSTSSDLARFFRALLRGELFGEDMLAEMTKTVPTGTEFNAGLGLFRADLPCGSAWGHGGDTGIYTNQVLASRDGSTIVVVARNVTDWFNFKTLAEEMYCEVI